MNEPTGFRFGFGLSGLLAAGLAYLAFDLGLFSGPMWLGVLSATVIGAASAGSMMLIERVVAGAYRARAAGAERAPIVDGGWGCPRCGSAYVRDATVCSDCHVPLVEAGAE